jgi:uncharacterized surface protein with fasciclin (FAS1) repeats
MLTLLQQVPLGPEGCLHPIGIAVTPLNLVAQAPDRSNTIVDIASANPTFSTLVRALKAAGLVETLSGRTQFTVFAPTNEAFAALPKGTLESLLKPENRDSLGKILTYHVVPGAEESRSLRPGAVPTVEGNPVNVRISHGRIQVNRSRVVAADVRASNGVIHVIDRVLIPPGL